MSKLLFKLRHVPNDEADDVRNLLQQNNIEFFETFAGNWGISLPALWVVNDEDFVAARQLIDSYQEQRQIRIREEYQQSVMRGDARTMWHSFMENPLRFVLYMGLATLVLYFSVVVFTSL